MNKNNNTRLSYLMKHRVYLSIIQFIQTNAVLCGFYLYYR
jgi:hypothetical protein